MIPITAALDVFNNPAIGYTLIFAFVGLLAIKLVFHK